MPSAWMQKRLLDLLSKKINGLKISSQYIPPPKVVQVLNCNEENRSLLISDKECHITLFLTSNCLDTLKEDDITFSSLRHCIIKLERYHFSTVTQSIGHRDEKKFASQGVTFPIALQSDKITFLGADDSDVLGEPHDLNSMKKVQDILSTMTYIEMTNKLRIKQFPNSDALPNSGTNELSTKFHFHLKYLLNFL